MVFVVWVDCCYNYHIDLIAEMMREFQGEVDIGFVADDDVCR